MGIANQTSDVGTLRMVILGPDHIAVSSESRRANGGTSESGIVWLWFYGPSSR